MADIVTLATGMVTCQVAVTTNDGADDDARFDAVAPTGWVYLRPRRSIFPEGSPTVAVIPDVVSLVVREDGWAVMADQDGVPVGDTVVEIPVVEGMTWQVSMDLSIPAYPWQSGVERNRIRVEPFDIPVEAGQTTNVADYLPLGVDPDTGATWVKGDPGTPGKSVTSVRAVDGQAIFTLSDGTDLEPITLPKGNDGAGIPSGGSENQVPARTSDGGSAWRTVADLISDATTESRGLMSAADKARLDATASAASVTSGDASTLAAAKTYADSKDAATLAAAKQYADSQVVADTSYGTVDALQRLAVGATWNVREADPAFWLQGASINEDTGEIYAVNQLNASPYNICAIEVRDLQSGALKSRKTFTTSDSAFTESGTWFMNNGDLCFVVRPATASADTASKAAIYNFSKGVLGPSFDILGQCKGAVANDCYYTTDAWGTFASRVFVYDWASVQAAAPTLKRTIYLEDSGTTIEKTQGLEVIQDKIYLGMGGGNGTPAIAVYDHDGLRLGAVLYNKKGFASALNASKPGTVTNVSGYVYESEGATSYKGMLASIHVIDRQATVVYHGSKGSVKTTLQPLPYRAGWVTLVPSDTSWTVPYGTLRYRVRRGYLEISGYITNSTFSGGYTTIFTFPEWARPKQSASFVLGANTTASMAVRIEVSGELQMYSSVATGAWRCLDVVRVPLER